jgi:hypothetical protein
LAISACAEEPVADDESGTNAEFTYSQHIQPILEARCGACHYEQGIGSFSLTTYEDAETWADYASEVVDGELMPPFPPATEGCSPIDDARDMPRAERDMFVQWVADGHPLGDPEAPPEYTVPLPTTSLGAPSHSFPIHDEYIAPVEVFEEYRCFRIDPDITSATSLSALHVDTGTPERFHQARVSIVPPDRVEEVTALEGNDGRPGWPCYYNTTWVLEPGSQFVVDAYLHHYTFDPLDLSVVGWGAPLEDLESPSTLTMRDDTFVIPAGVESFTSTVEADVVPAASDPATLSPDEVREGSVWRVDVHMHQWGRAATVEIEHTDGTRTCLLDIPSWDPEWQGSYSLETPVPTAAGDVIVASCEWSNRAEDQPLVNGAQIPVEEVGWGLDELHEMCEVRLMLDPA